MELKEQVQRIQAILGKPQIPFYRFTFGKYVNQTLLNVVYSDRDYVKFLISNVDLSLELKNKLRAAIRIVG